MSSKQTIPEFQCLECKCIFNPDCEFDEELECPECGSMDIDIYVPMFQAPVIKGMRA